MSNQKISKEEIHIVGIELRTCNQNGQAYKELPIHWKRFLEDGILEKIPNKKNNQVYSLYTDYEGDYMQPYSCILGCAVSYLDDLPEGLVHKVIPKATYEVYPVQGKDPGPLAKQWMDIWASPLKRTYSGDFDLYPEEFWQNPNPSLEVYVAIEEK